MDGSAARMITESPARKRMACVTGRNPAERKSRMWHGLWQDIDRMHLFHITRAVSCKGTCPDITLNLKMLLPSIRNVFFHGDFSRGLESNRMITKLQSFGFLCRLLPRPPSF